MLYERLQPDMQQTVDEFAERIADLPWAQKSDALASAALPFAERYEGPQATLAGKGFLTAVLERLGDRPIDDATQAVLLSLSLNPHHQEAAASWLTAHPEVATLVQTAWATDEPEGGPEGGGAGGGAAA
ncbi:MAG TPA: hypothetical protein VF100_11070 [Thermoanaerobaculia bacterium]